MLWMLLLLLLVRLQRFCSICVFIAKYCCIAFGPSVHVVTVSRTVRPTQCSTSAAITAYPGQSQSAGLRSRHPLQCARRWHLAESARCTNHQSASSQHSTCSTGSSRPTAANLLQCPHWMLQVRSTSKRITVRLGSSSWDFATAKLICPGANRLCAHTLSNAAIIMASSCGHKMRTQHPTQAHAI